MTTSTQTLKQFGPTPYLGTLAVGLLIYSLIPGSEDWLKEARNEIARADDQLSTPASKIEIITPERSGSGSGTDRGGEEQVPTETSTVPYFPRKIWLPRTGAGVDDGKSAALPAGTGVPADQDEEYQLLGLGIRTVSFLSIQVYVVGLYVAHSDLATLQEKLVHAAATAAPAGASTLVQGEKDDLKQNLLEEHGSEAIWSDVLKERGGRGLKSALRIVPTRSTNFAHLRDGWVRMITARGKGPEYSDAMFEPAIAQFKAIFGGRKLEKGKALLLRRAADGSLGAWVEEDLNNDAAAAAAAAAGDLKKATTGTQAATTPPGAPARVTAATTGIDKDPPGRRMAWMGGVQDERISRLVWMGYLAGAKVASEGARRSVVDGVMELVERPIGTVDTQVV